MNRLKSAAISILAIAALIPVRLFADDESFNRSVPVNANTVLKLDCRVARVSLSSGQGQDVVISAKGTPEPLVSVSESLVTVTVPEPGLNKRGPELRITMPSLVSTVVAIDVGDLDIYGLGGRLEAKVGVGNVSMSGVFGQASARTGTGNIKATWADGQELPDQCRFSTGIGDIRVGLPSDADVRITAETGLGSIQGLGPRGAGRTRSQTAGQGDRSMALSVGIGDIRVRRGENEDGEPGRNIKWEGRRGRAREYFGGGGGFFASWPDRSYLDFNAATSGHGYPAVKKESYGWGGEGYAQFGRFRIGGMGWGNQIESRSSLSDTVRYVTYDYGFGGLTLEYVVLRSRRADLSLGAMLGGGGSEIRLAKAKKTDITWDEAAALEDYREVAVNASGLAGMPMARFKLKLLSWLSLQGQAGYLYCRASDWKYRQDQDLFNSPRLDASGWVFALGPHFGF